MTILLILPFVLVIFWLWMFWEMTTNDNLPNCYFTLTAGRNVRLDWMVAFIFLSILTAGYYYFTEYNK
jgi:hypothetical protein